MKIKTHGLTQERLKELVTYDSVTGTFISKVDRGAVKVGDALKGDKHTSGYSQLSIYGIRYFAHRLAFLYMTGETPKYIDHRDNNRQNNSWNNLRKATASQNAWNSQIPSDNTTGIKGLSYNTSEKAYYAAIKSEGKRYTKSFACRAWGKDKAKELATIWLRETREQLHKEFANHG